MFLDFIFKKPKKDGGNNPQKERYYDLPGYIPVYTTYGGEIYEQELIRASIHSFALRASKLSIQVKGNDKLNSYLKYRANKLMTTSQFLYRLATILSVNNTAFIVPVIDNYGMVSGYCPILPAMAELLYYEENPEKPYFKYTFMGMEQRIIDFEKVGILTQFQYKDDLIGENNTPLNNTLDLIKTFDDNISNGIKNSKYANFSATLSEVVGEQDIEKVRNDFIRQNFGDNKGIIVHDPRIKEVKQIVHKPFPVDAAQTKLIQENVYRYFGTNDNILQNKATEDEENSFYQSKVEGFSVQLSQVLTTVTFDERTWQENNISVVSGRLKYASEKTKLEICKEFRNTGIFSYNDIADIYGFAHRADGDKLYIRKEYSELDKLHTDEKAGVTDE
ncbi:hypothetical protein FACS1894188_03780 [Clostridia bacterium]|nr:hypothetical protein FACS1894188_03780 [Clostridia bacterium]